MKEELRNDLQYALVDNHRMHIFTAGDKNKPKLVFMSGSATIAPMYDFKILYEKLITDFRIIVIEKFGYGYSDLYDGPCDIDSVISFQRQALEQYGENGPYILAPHSMSGLEAIRWKQKYPDEVAAIIGLDMATPKTYMEWGGKEFDRRIAVMKRLRRLNNRGLLFWYPLNKRGLNKYEAKQQKLLFKRNMMNDCLISAAEAVAENARIVSSSVAIDCPILMFISDGKQVSANWIEYEKEFARETDAGIVHLNCGHYIHYYESEQISDKIKEFCAQMN